MKFNYTLIYTAIDDLRDLWEKNYDIWGKRIS